MMFRRYALLVSFVSLMLSFALAMPLTAQEATPETDTEQTFRPNPAQFISSDPEAQTVDIVVIAAYDETNAGLNFNGFANGDARYTVPEGWTVNVTFQNYSDQPHSALVVPPEATDEIRVGDPVFEGASTENPVQGTSSMQTFTFTAAEQGEYALACGVPTHAANGHWIWFEVGPSDSQPTLTLGEQEPYVAEDQPEAARFIAPGVEDNSVLLNVIASYDDTNDGFNFNGYANGNAVYQVPEGWTVNVVFQNYSDQPHSAIIVPPDATSEIRVGEPVFEGASTENPVDGTTRRQTFSFTAAEEGDYVLACGVPTHAQNGHWIRFEVVSADAQPSIQLGDGKPYTPEALAASPAAGTAEASGS